MKYILINILLFLFIFYVYKSEAKPFNNEGICETVVVENGEVISRKIYPCE